MKILLFDLIKNVLRRSDETVLNTSMKYFEEFFNLTSEHLEKLQTNNNYFVKKGASGLLKEKLK